MPVNTRKRNTVRKPATSPVFPKNILSKTAARVRDEIVKKGRTARLAGLSQNEGMRALREGFQLP